MLTSLSGKDVARLVDLGRTMFEAPTGAALREAVGPRLLDLFGADHYASFVFDDAGGDGEPVVLNMDRANIDRYRAHYQFRDPITARMRRCGRAVHVNGVMAQDELERTEFFNDFLQRDGLHYGMNFHALAWRDGRWRHLGDLRIWRGRRRGNFDGRDIDLLQAVGELFQAALATRHDVRAAPVPAPAERFALRHGLTAGEKRVLDRLAAGQRDAEIAAALGISAETVRSHLKAIFGKSGLAGRAAVISALFSDA